MVLIKLSTNSVFVQGRRSCLIEQGQLVGQVAQEARQLHSRRLAGFEDSFELYV